MVMMEIKLAPWRWRSKAQDGYTMSHIIFACDVYMFMHLILLSSRR